MTQARIEVNRAGIGRILNSTEVRAMLRDRVKAVAGTARATAPVESGEYRDSIEAVVEQHKDRPVGRAYARSDHSTAVESIHRTLGRALAAET